MGTEVAHGATGAKERPGVGLQGIGAEQGFVHHVFQQNREVAGALGEGGGHNGALVHAIGLDAGTGQAHFSQIQQLAAPVGVGGIYTHRAFFGDGNGGAGQHGVDHGVTVFVGLITHGIDDDVAGNGCVGAAQVGQQLEAGLCLGAGGVVLAGGAQSCHAVAVGEFGEAGVNGLAAGAVCHQGGLHCGLQCGCVWGGGLV